MPAFRCSIKRLLPIFWKEEKIRCYNFLFEKSTDCVTDCVTDFALIIGRQSLILQMKALIKTFHLPYQRASGHLLLESYYHLLRMEMSSEMSLTCGKTIVSSWYGSYLVSDTSSFPPAEDPSSPVTSATNGMAESSCPRFRPRRRVTSSKSTGQADRAPAKKSELRDLWDDAASGMSPEDIDAAWVRLLEETLPPDKQEALMVTYESEKDPKMRYNMLLEFSSYLRQVSIEASLSICTPGKLLVHDACGEFACGHVVVGFHVLQPEVLPWGWSSPG